MANYKKGILLIGIIVLLIALPVEIRSHLTMESTTTLAGKPVASPNPSENLNNDLFFNKPNNTIFTVGGYYLDKAQKREIATNSAEFYNFKTNKWVVAPPMNYTHAGAGVAVYLNKIYVFGGQKDGIYGATSTVEEFDPSNNKWTVKTSMPHPKFYNQAITLNGKIYILGGMGNAQGLNNTVDVYNPETNTWSKAPDMPITQDYYGQKCQAAVGRIYCPGIGEHEYTLEYNPVTNLWSNIPTQNRDLNTNQNWMSDDTMIYSPVFKNKANGLLAYNPASDTITSTKLNYYIHPSYQAYGAVAINGTLYLVGGRFTSNPVRDVYIYSLSSSSTWKKTSPLNVGRASAGTVVLPFVYTKNTKDISNGSISGIITNNGRPYSNVKVMLSWGSNFVESSYTYADRNGRYTFINLAPGTYRVLVQQAGSTGGFSVPEYKDHRQDVDLRDGEKIVDYNYAARSGI